MSMLNFTTTPPTVHMSDSSKTEDFALLQPRPVDNGDGEIDHVYELTALAQLTRNLMSMLHISYDRQPEKTRRELADFTDTEKQLYLPFAFMLACLDGNAFRTGQLNAAFDSQHEWPPSPETISQYIPDACHILTQNSATPDELLAMVRDAAQVYPDINPAIALKVFGGRPEGTPVAGG